MQMDVHKMLLKFLDPISRGKTRLAPTLQTPMDVTLMHLINLLSSPLAFHFFEQARSTVTCRRPKCVR